MTGHLVSPVGHVARATVVDKSDDLELVAPLKPARRRVTRSSEDVRVPDWASLLAGSRQPTPETMTTSGLLGVVLAVPEWDSHTLAWWREQARLQLETLLVTLGRRRTAAVETAHVPGYVVARVPSRRL